MVKMDKKLRRMDSDNQFVMEEVNGGIRTIEDTVEKTFSLILGSLFDIWLPIAVGAIGV